MKAAEPSFETEEKAKCSPCVVKVKRTKYLIGLLLVLLMLPTTLLFPSAELIARDCGNAENGEGCSSPGEYDVPSDFLPKINGPEEPNAVGAYDYLITGGCPPYKWEVVPNESKSTVSIDQNGRLQLTAGSCGSYTIKVTDGCGHGSLFAGKVGYNSQWVSIESCWDPNWIWPLPAQYIVYERGYKYVLNVVSPWAGPGRSVCADFCPAAQTCCSAVGARCGMTKYE